jgi:serine/threonine protein kinase
MNTFAISSDFSCPLCGDSRVKKDFLPSLHWACGKCRAKTPAKPLIPIPQCSPSEKFPSVPGYEITRKLGEGGMGTVYEARQSSLKDRGVALKILNCDIAGAEALDSEVSALSRLSHPAVVKIYDLARFDGGAALIIELILGPGGDPLSLRDIAAFNKGGVSPLAAVSAALQLAKALRHAHSAGILHLDLKPENVLCDPAGNIRLVDFGISKLKQPDKTKRVIPLKTVPRELFGTPGYSAPEMCDENFIPGPAQDVYALGVLLYELLTGLMPAQDFKFPSELLAGPPPVMDEIIDKSINFHPEKRYPSMSAFADALSNALGVVSASGASSAQPAERKAPESRASVKTYDEKAANPEEILKRAGYRSPAGFWDCIPPKKKMVIFMMAGFAVFIFAFFAAAIVFIDSNMRRGGGDSRKPAAAAETPSPSVPVKTSAQPPVRDTGVKAGAPTPDAFVAEGMRKMSSGAGHLSDPKGAAELFARAAAMGDPEGQFMLADCRLKGFGVVRDEPAALALFLAAAEKGHSGSVNAAGEMFLNGDGCPAPDYQRAAELFKKAADMGNSDAMRNLGDCFYFGRGVKTDYSRAAELYSAAAEKNNGAAMFALARAYIAGNGVSKDPAKARELIEKSAAAGYYPAREAMSVLNGKGSGAPAR